MALLSRALIRKSAIATVTRLAVTTVSLVLQDSSGTRLDAPGARAVQRSSHVRGAANEGPLLVSYVSERPARGYLELAVRAYQRQQRHSHCPKHGEGSE